jgi:hypothetical protein
MQPVLLRTAAAPVELRRIAAAESAAARLSSRQSWPDGRGRFHWAMVNW